MIPFFVFGKKIMQLADFFRNLMVFVMEKKPMKLKPIILSGEKLPDLILLI
jgi:hypothetical protein